MIVVPIRLCLTVSNGGRSWGIPTYYKSSACLPLTQTRRSLSRNTTQMGTRTPFCPRIHSLIVLKLWVIPMVALWDDVHDSVNFWKMFECALGMQYLHGVNSHLIRNVNIVSHRRRFQRGIIHGSLKPSNILVAENGQACIADYGMIELKTSESTCARYFSPEAWKGVWLSRWKYLYVLIILLYRQFPKLQTSSHLPWARTRYT